MLAHPVSSNPDEEVARAEALRALPQLTFVMGNTGADMDSCVSGLTVAAMLNDIGDAIGKYKGCHKDGFTPVRRSSTNCPLTHSPRHPLIWPGEVRVDAAQDEQRTFSVGDACSWHNEMVPVPVIQVDAADELHFETGIYGSLEEHHLSPNDFLLWPDVEDIVQFAQEVSPQGGDRWPAALKKPQLVLVDHNVPETRAAHLDVLGVIDHHAALHPRHTMLFSSIGFAGSTTSRIVDFANWFDVPVKTWARDMLAHTIVMDTMNFSEVRCWICRLVSSSEWNCMQWWLL